MKAIALLYHDVVKDGDYRSSGFEGGDADTYKLDRDVFERHLDAIARVISRKPSLAADLFAGPATVPVEPTPLLMTFDDGGASAYHIIAAMLERRGWRGHFFVATDFIGRAAFLTAPQIRALHERGHVIGSHSSSHPSRISHLRQDRILEEWSRSVGTLADILGASVKIASVPGGFYSPAVARGAAQAGIRVLFNSEPTLRVRQVEGCWVAGRFGLQQLDSEQTAAAFATGVLTSRLCRWGFWNAKKVIKVVGGETWLALRRRLLSR